MLARWAPCTGAPRELRPRHAQRLPSPRVSSRCHVVAPRRTLYVRPRVHAAYHTQRQLPGRRASRTDEPVLTLPDSGR